MENTDEFFFEKLTISFKQITEKVNLYETDYICLNDLAKFFPSKRISNWLENQKTQDFIAVVERQLSKNYDTSISSYHKSAIFTVRGKGKEQGTYAHELVALEFLAWLSPEFKVLIFSQWNEWRKEQNAPKSAFSDKLMEVLREEMEEYFVRNDDMEGVVNSLVRFINETKNRLGNLENRDNYISKKVRELEKAVGYIQAEQQKQNANSYVYLMYNAQTKEYKLGKSNNPQIRQKQLQGVEPNIEIVLEIPLYSARQAFTLESLFKETFKAKNTHGEWYKLDEGDIQKIKLIMDALALEV
jgi:hypothetical protein